MNNKVIEISNGINLHLMQTDKFKTNSLVVTLNTELNRETVTKNALIPLVLRRGTKNYHSMKEISIKLEKMYGASLDANADKIGDYLTIQFMMDVISDEYTLEKSNLLAEAIELLNEVILYPELENGTFNTEFVEQEKETLRELINSKINDKGTYASERTVEEMYKSQAYGLYKYGYIEDLDSINAENLYAQYKELLKTCEIQIYICGNFDENKVINKFESSYKNVERSFIEKKMNFGQNTLSENSPKEINESQNVTQGKLVLGYHLMKASPVDDFYKMTVYSAILGGTASSKLFCNVREKKSLAYTIRSQYIKHKCALFVSAGIELENYELAKESILKEINDMKIGEITEQEINDAKVNLITRFRSFNDSQGALIGWAIGQELLKGDIDLDVVIKKIEAISKEDILDVANRLEHAITYYLKN